MANITQYDNPLLNSAIQKSWKRLVPLMFIMYFVAFIDRVNVGFAKDAMKLDIGLSESAFALGAGIFFAAYALFGIPANLILNKIGAQKWLSITTAIWGLLSAMMGFVTGETQFIILRFLLGLGEAGFSIPEFYCSHPFIFLTRFADRSWEYLCWGCRWR